jgi:muconolactone delta-isomerase
VGYASRPPGRGEVPPGPAGYRRSLAHVTRVTRRAADDAGMQAILRSLPLYPWLSVPVTPLSPHPSDPGNSRQ